MKVFLFDIEGTTTDINFVHKVLFPYSRERMQEFVLSHPDLPALKEVPGSTLEEKTRQLDLWIAEDKKVGALKELQGLIWENGYAKGDFQGHVYPDVRPFFEKLKDRGFTIAIYSSGSVHAQKLIFEFSSAGDLTKLISSYFDTKVGHKREAASYQKIAQELSVPSSDIHFFSDIAEEITAALASGMKATQVIRPGTTLGPFHTIRDFTEVQL